MAPVRGFTLTTPPADLPHPTAREVGRSTTFGKNDEGAAEPAPFDEACTVLQTVIATTAIANAAATEPSATTRARTSLRIAPSAVSAEVCIQAVFGVSVVQKKPSNAFASLRSPS
jgi:hypothetical protein